MHSQVCTSVNSTWFQCAQLIPAADTATCSCVAFVRVFLAYDVSTLQIYPSLHAQQIRVPLVTSTFYQLHYPACSVRLYEAAVHLTDRDLHEPYSILLKR